MINLCIYNNPGDTEIHKYRMNPLRDGIWEIIFIGELYNKYYGFQIYQKDENVNSEKPICLDPYAKVVTSKNSFMGQKLSMVYKDNFDWQNDEWIQNDWRDLIIYEAHVKDLTSHKSSGAENAGTYSGMIEHGIKGGINHIKNLGINCVELLPCMEYSYNELPFKKELNKRFNTWNPYETNHWGYMTSAFFAPTANYSYESITAKWDEWVGKSGNQINEFKSMVKAFHKEGIAIIMDVVFNHLSEYELANLKEIDQEYYFRYDHDGKPSNQSGCANDLKTERPMVRRLIIDSILYWMKEYHIDGFRFDLGHLIDWETIEEVTREAKKYNPHVIFVTEPWGGGYDPKGFSVRDVGSWNDQIRNGIKGENPYNGKGWLFEHWYGNNNPEHIKSYVGLAEIQLNCCSVMS
jgi:pullulanase/glycogen debranching enzyme